MTYAQNQPTYPATLSGLDSAARDGVALADRFAPIRVDGREIVRGGYVWDEDQR